MRQAQQQQQSFGPSPAGMLNFVGWLVHTWATSVEVFLRKGFGEQYLGIHAAAVILLVPIYGVFWQGHDLRPLLWFVPVYLVFVAFARLGIASRKRKGIRIHSHYSGYPRCIKSRSKLSEVQFKRYVEPVVAAATGMSFLAMGEQPLGVYLIIAGASLFLSVSMSELQFEQGAVSMHDQVIEQQYIAERFRAMQGNGF